MGLADKLLADGERPLAVLRPHVRRLAWPALLLLALAPAAAFAAGAVPPGPARAPVRFAVTAIAGLVAVRWVIWPFMLWWNTLYVLTDERFFERGGLVRRTGHDLPLQGVSDVVVAQSLGERLLRSGTLRVITDGGGEVVVRDVPAVSRVQRSLLAVADDITERLRAPRAWGAEADVEDEPDEPAPPVMDDRSEARRREREARRRLGEIQDRIRRTPVPDSPLEDGGDEEDEDPPGDDAEGARILRFPPRP